MEKKINVDVLHEKWMQSAEDFAWKHLGKGGGKSQTYAFFSPIDTDIGDPMDYNIIGRIELPSKTDVFLMHMARCTMAVPYMSEPCVKKLGLKRPPVPIFCLSSLLETAIPKSVSTQFFRGTIGCVFLGGMESQYKIAMEIASMLDNDNDGLGVEPLADQTEDLDDQMRKEIDNHAAFYGLGVILMKASREVLDPLASNEQIVKLALNHYLGKI